MDSLAAYLSLAISIGAVVLGIINHKRIRSSCCGKQASVSLDIEATTPPIQKSLPLLYNGTAQGHESQEGESLASSRKSSESQESR